MRPLDLTLDEMKGAVAHLEALRDPEAPASDRDTTVAHLARVRDEAGERRKKLVRQLEMAAEFIGILDRETA